MLQTEGHEGKAESYQIILLSSQTDHGFSDTLFGCFVVGF